MTKRFAAALICLSLALTAPRQLMRAQQAPALDRVLNALTFRNIGPFRTAAWVTAVAVPETPLHDHLYTIYAASRSGGLWKTTNAGTTWTNVTDSIGAEAMGAVAVAPSNPNIVWIGEGDQANARSSISGKGVFKSIDAGATWQFMGLPDSHHIARIVIHPKNPDIVYVAAIGPSLLEEPRARRVPHHGRRQDLEEGAVHRRRRRRHRPGDQPQDPHHALRRDVRQGSEAVADRRERSRERHLPDRRRGREMGEARRRAADRQDRPHRPGHLSEEPAHPLRVAREPESEAGRAGARRQRGQPARRRHHRQRDVPDRRRRQELAQGDGGQRRRRQGPLFIQPDAHRPARRPDGDRHERFDVHLARRRQDLGVGLHARRVRRLPRDVVGSRRQGPHHPRQRRRRQRLGRRRQDRRLLPQHGRRRSLRGGRRHGRSLQRLRRHAGSRFLEGPEQRPDRADHARELGHGRPRRRHVQRRRSDRQPLGLQHARAELDGADGSEDRRAHADRAVAPAGAAAAALQLDRADRALAAQSEDRLRRRAGALPLAQPGGHVGRDQSGSHDQRSRQDRPQRALLHDHFDLGITAQGGHDLDRHRRRQGADHGRRRRRLDRPHAGIDRGRRARRIAG